MNNNALDEALYSHLAGGTALTHLLGGTAIYYGKPPSAGVLPWVVVSFVAGTEENQTPHRSQRWVYLVKGVASSVHAAGEIASEIDNRLHGVTLTVTGATQFWAARETIVRYQELDDVGHTIGNAGGTYAFRTEDS